MAAREPQEMAEVATATGNMLLVPLGAMNGKLGVGDIARNLTLVLLGNLLGALFVAYFLAVQTGSSATRTPAGRPA